MEQYLVTYILTGVSREEQVQIGAYNETDAINRIRNRFGFSNVTIKHCRKA